MPSPSVARRVSYVVPPPIEPRTKLVLPALGAPRRGRTVPLVVPDTNTSSDTQRTRRRVTGPRPRGRSSSPNSRHAPQPTHRLGVSALAVDLSTHIAGKSSPEGILYSAGRDGLVIAWELGAPTKPRRRDHRESPTARHSQRRGDWKAMTGWDDDQDLSDEESSSSGGASALDLTEGVIIDDIHGSNPHAATSSRAGFSQSIPYEQRWQIDSDHIDGIELHSSFRQCVQSHNDWINDITLCNLNQNVISASNDGTVKTWSPHHSKLANSPSYLGKHSDYVKCLAHSPRQTWVASGSFDRTIKLWDVSRPTNSLSSLPTPITTLSLGDNSHKSSVYALAVDGVGNLLASGSPERVVRLWDPRVGKKVGKLVGHTDNIRSILLSNDGKYVITGSSDASIKVWSVAGQRCLYTFAHHSDSVWKLFSSHSSLSVFYSGDRSGLVCKVDMENCGDMSEGECVVICRDTPDSTEGASRSRGKEGINTLLALDDWAVWTATGASDIKRWRDPGRRSSRMKTAGTQQWDQFSLSPTRVDTFGFSHLTTGMNLSRSPTPVGSSNMMIRSESRQSKSDSPYIAAGSDSTRPTPPFTPTSPSSSPVTHRPGPRQSIQSHTGSVVFVDEPGSGELPSGSDQTLFDIPFDSLVKLASPNELYGLITAGRDPEVATLYSAASVLSVPAPLRPSPTPAAPSPSAFSQALARSGSNITSQQHSAINRASSITSFGYGLLTGADLIPSAQMNYESRELAVDATSLRSEPDEVLRGSHGLVRGVLLNDRVHALTVDTAGEVALWDLIRAACRGYYSSSDVDRASRANSGAGYSADTQESAVEWSPRGALETVRECIEGEAMIASWANVETKMGCLTVHLTESTCFDAEVYADEAGFADASAFPEEHRINAGRWILFNLFLGFVHAESLSLAGAPALPPNIPHAENMGAHHTATHNQSKAGDGKARRLRSNSELTVMGQKAPSTPAAVATPNMAPAIVPPVAQPQDIVGPLSPSRGGSTVNLGRGPLPSIPAASANPLYPGSPTPRGGGLNLPTTPGTTPHAKAVSSVDYFSPRPSKSDAEDPDAGDQSPGTSLLHSGLKSSDATSLPLSPSGPTPPGGGFIGRLKSLGKGAAPPKRPVAAEDIASPVPVIEGAGVVDESVTVKAAKWNFQFLDSLQGQNLPLPSPLEAPRLQLPAGTIVIIAEQASGESGWTTIYDGPVSSTKEDVRLIEATAPLWVLESLFANKYNQQGAAKLSFMVAPWNKGDDDPLPDLMSSQSRLTASRALRVHKVVLYVVEKLESIAQEQQHKSANTLTPSAEPGPTGLAPASHPASPRSSSEQILSSPSTAAERHHRAAGEFEILCNDVVLPNNMTLAAVRHYVWRQGNELTMHYRRKLKPL